MTHSELLWDSLDQALWELGEALREMPSSDLWVRPSSELLSVGEIAAHLAYWQAETFCGSGHVSRLSDVQGRYYTTNVDQVFKLALTAEEVWEELVGVHAACKEAFLALKPDLEAANPNREGWTWRATLQYQAFHLAYHAGQIYSVRHLLGHATVDN